MGDFDNGNNSMLDMYLFESTSLLEQLDDILLESEKDNTLSQENINEIFRIMHTIKGSSAMMEFNIISFVSHKLEDLFYVIRDNGLAQEHFEPLFDLVLRVSDFLKDEVDKIQQEQPLCEQNDELVNEILAFLAMLKDDGSSAEAPAPVAAATVAEAESEAEPVSEAMPKTEADSEPEAPQEDAATTDEATSDAGTTDAAPTEGENTYFIFARFAAGCQMENIRAFMLVNKLNTVGKVLSTNPESLDGNPDASAIIVDSGFYCQMTSDKSPEEILSVGKTAPSVEIIEFTDNMGKGGKKAATPDQKPAAPAKQDSQATAPKTAEEPKQDQKSSSATDTAPAATKAQAPAQGSQAPAGDNAGGSAHSHKQNLINVDLSKLDALMDLVGELVIAESMVSGNSDLEGLKLENFEKASRQLRKLTTELQDIAMSIRMVPIAATFQKMKRIVRDMGKKLDKDVELVLMGETTEVDKTIVDAIADPLMHLVRNSMDHGIEDRAERAETSKDPTSRIILSAQNLGGDIIIAVSDDGRGLDAQKILAKAANKGILTKPENEMTEKEIFNLLMAPGFSTKEAVTEYSGRGVGMDVVKKNIEKIGGTVSIESTKGAGMTVYFKIPLTLAIVDSMEIRVGECIYTIPISNIRESFKTEKSQVFSDPNGNEMIMIRGACYPIIRLNRIFNVPNSIENIEDGILLLIDSGDRLACLLADDLIGKFQVVVKPLPPYIGHFTRNNVGISGCTIMGDGSISLILDTQEILATY